VRNSRSTHKIINYILGLRTGMRAQMQKKFDLFRKSMRGSRTQKNTPTGTGRKCTLHTHITYLVTRLDTVFIYIHAGSLLNAHTHFTFGFKSNVCVCVSLCV